MSSLNILAFDPGTSKTAWCRLIVHWGLSQPVTTTFVAGGWENNTIARFCELVQAPDTGLVCIEKPEAYAYKRKWKSGYDANMVKNLMATDGIAKQIETVAMLANRELHQLTAVKIRRLICGKGNAKDATVAVAVKRLVYGWPARSNAHVRDAAMCGLAAGWRHASLSGGRVPL